MRILMLTAGMIAAFCSATAFAQHKPKSSDEVARDYNKSAQTILDEIDTLHKKLAKSDLSMGDAAKLIEQESRLRKQADDAWTTSQKAINNSYSDARKQITQYNDDNKKLEFQSVVSSGYGDFMSNVAKSGDKATFEKGKDALSKDWDKTYGSRLKPFGEEFAKQKDDWFAKLKDGGIDLAKDGYSRIGTYNPYTGEVYYKYYGNDGKLDLITWDKDADGWKKANADFRKSRQRQQELKSTLDKDAAQLTRDGAAVKATGKTLSGSMTDLEKVAKRVNFAGSWSGNDDVGNTVQLTLNSDGSMNYSYSGRAQPYSSGGTWSQSGRQITARTRDGIWTLQSRITEQFRLEFDENSNAGGKFRNFLSR